MCSCTASATASARSEIAQFRSSHRARHAHSLVADDNLADAIRRALANGTHGALGLRTENCQKTFEELTAKGVEFIQPPTERPYGTEAIIRDNSGNWLVLVERKEYSPVDFE
ncbi:VOC family protein [Nocardia sp. NPDC051052]|uniref:VOC family protein n=1 Tax=Nocardia sp. NPDC051052 TaxID=3364322 RepID=UPI0037927DD2